MDGWIDESISEIKPLLSIICNYHIIQKLAVQMWMTGDIIIKRGIRYQPGARDASLPVSQLGALGHSCRLSPGFHNNRNLKYSSAQRFPRWRCLSMLFFKCKCKAWVILQFAPMRGSSPVSGISGLFCTSQWASGHRQLKHLLHKNTISGQNPV